MNWLDEVVEGYRDGYHDDRPELPTPTNRSDGYLHGWLNGRDDRRREPRATAQDLREIGDAIRAEEA